MRLLSYALLYLRPGTTANTAMIAADKSTIKSAIAGALIFILFLRVCGSLLYLLKS
jgi:hypothetical protein